MADESDSGETTNADLGEFADSGVTGDGDSDSTASNLDADETAGSGSVETAGSGPDGTTDFEDSGTTGSESGDTADADDADPVEVGVELLSKLEHAELSVAEAVDRIETVTTHPATTRTILDEAEKRGIIEREQGIVRPTGGGYVSFQSEVVTKEGEFSCRRCGASISEGYFIKLDAGEHGAFGPECIRKVTGRD